MAYREVGTMDIDQVIRRWLAGEKIRAIARLTGLADFPPEGAIVKDQARRPARESAARSRLTHSPSSGLKS